MKNKRTIAIVCILAFAVLAIAATAIAAAVNSKKTQADISVQPTSAAKPTLITDGNIATSESELPTVEATDTDFAILADMLFDCSLEYDCTADNATQTAYSIALGHLNGIFEHLYAQNYEIKHGQQDPLQLFAFDGTKVEGYEYCIFPADKVDYIIETILNATPDRNIRLMSEINTPSGVQTLPWLYYDNGYYVKNTSIEGTLADKMEVASHTKEENGRYTVVINCVEIPDNVIFALTVDAALKSVNGEKVWSIYKISNSLYTPAQNAPTENELDMPEITTVEITTAEVTTVESVQTTQSIATSETAVHRCNDLYKEYYYSNHSDSDKVILTDLTHDGQDDMLVISNGAHNLKDLIIYTCLHDCISELFTMSLPNNRSTVMLNETADGSYIVYESAGIWQGKGSIVCEEYYFSSSGEMITVDTLSQHFGGDQWELDQYEYGSEEYNNYVEQYNAQADSALYEKISSRYGAYYEDLYLLYETDTSNTNAFAINLIPSYAFN
ncbi:MAG: hypothetical protein IKJ63_01645 [Clostridia bacterium]|nr:hypothetical protein [Clostridia bacterium]